MKIFKLKNEIWLWLIILLPFVVFFKFRNRLPENMPTHFDEYGKVNGYMHPLHFILIIGGLNVLIYFLLMIAQIVDPKRANYLLFKNAFFGIRLSSSLLLSGIACLTIIYAIGNHINITKIVVLAVLFFFIVLGNFMPNIHPNWFIGIRTPWTLSNEIVWKKTHKLAGRLLFFTALLGFIFVLFASGKMVVLVVFPVLIIGLMIPIVYSYFEYKKNIKTLS